MQQSEHRRRIHLPIRLETCNVFIWTTILALQALVLILTCSRLDHLRPFTAILMPTETDLASKKSWRKCEMCINCKGLQTSDRGCPLTNSHFRVFTMLPPSIYNLWAVHHNQNILKHRGGLRNMRRKKMKKVEERI